MALPGARGPTGTRRHEGQATPEPCEPSPTAPRPFLLAFPFRGC